MLLKHKSLKNGEHGNEYLFPRESGAKYNLTD